MSLLKGTQIHLRLFGASAIPPLVKARVFGKRVRIGVTREGIRHPIYLRLRTTDVSLFEEIIVGGEYCVEPSRVPKTIIDAGANIGLSSVFFANIFPEARIMAIEPDSSNFAMLQMNTRLYPDIVPIHGALWREVAVLALSDPGVGEWGYQTREKRTDEERAGGVAGMTIDRLMRDLGCEHVDMLKIDIEGAEKEVFEASNSWIDKVGMIIVELHDGLKHGCSAAVHAATGAFEFTSCRGETTFFAREPYTIGSSQGGSTAPPRGGARIVKPHGGVSKIVSIESY